MATILSYVPILNRLVAPKHTGIDLDPVEVHTIDSDPDKRPRTLKHLLRANHLNHSIIYHNLQFDNHTPHILCSAYWFGAQPEQLHHIYEVESETLDPWKPSPSEITQEDWRDFLGDKRYQRAYIDFFEDALAMRHSYNWKKVIEEYMFEGEEPLVNGLIGGLGHPLIHLGYAFEFDSREIAIEALGLASVQYNFLHKYTDDPSYTRKSPFSSTSPLELLEKLASDDRFDGIFREPGFEHIEPLFQKHESLVLEYWNAWELDDPVKQFQESQEAAVALLVATVPPGTHSYNFFTCHVLTTSHAARILLPFLPTKFHVSLVRQWWLLTLAVYIAELRPKVDPDYIPTDLKGKGWKYVEHEALTNEWRTDAHFVKGKFHTIPVAKFSITNVALPNRAPPAMPPPAKRRKRTVIDDSDDNNEDDNSKNTLKRFLFSSPDSKPPAASRPIPINSSISIDSPTSPSPVRKRTTRAPSTSPEKSRGGGRKKGKIEAKGRTADLLTLFSKQAQKSQAANGNGAGSSKEKEALALEDIISDPISEEDADELVMHKTAAGSSIVGKTAQKRLKGSSQLQQQQQQGGSGMFGTAAGGGRFLKREQPQQWKGGVEEEDARPWSERFGPVNLEELAVHKKKVADVRKWLEEVMAGRMRQRLLVLKGAAGTGKTTTVQLLAKDMRCDVLEWRNPHNSFGMGMAQGYQSAAAQFEEFLGRGGKFGQLDLESDTPPLPSMNGSAAHGSHRRIILIEEFPNTFMRSSAGLLAFRNTILQFLAANTPALLTFGHHNNSEPITPIVMVVSETLLTTASASADSFTAHRLLGPEILRHPGTGVIEFNAVAPSLLSKALELVVQKEARKSGRRRTPGPLVLKRLGEIGDIRSAISSLEFLCVKGDDEADWGSKVAFTKPKRGAKDLPALTKGEEETLQLVSQREATLGIFHAVGKVVYNKRAEQGPPAGSAEAAVEMLPGYMAHLSRPKRSEVSVDTLIDETGTDTHTFISALHENFALSCEPTGPMDLYSSVDYLDGCLEYLSESDLLCPSWDIFFNGRGGSGGYGGKDSGSHLLRQDEMAFQVAVRGLLFSLPSPVKRRTHPTGRGGDSFKMFYPAYLKLWRAKEELESVVDMWTTKMLKGEDGVPGPPQGFLGGPAVFRKAQGVTGGGVESWANSTQMGSVHRLTQHAGDAGESATPPPLLSLGNAGRQEMLLERLPYMAHIARRKRCTFGTMRIRDLDRIVSFHGIGSAAAGETDDEEDEEEARGPAGEGEPWATDKPTEDGSPRKRRKQGLGTILSRGKAKDERGEEGLGMSGLPIQSLVLSDDDIEDD
ncbi:cell cycle checkpoint protein RAD17 [Podospora aff. communis PSN243]|uniref:Cell cycle checkpoint protein RAD17 n=1 Tax=Podospora aff. communis PSN243 TaxID=3040156 RepID=A0AAV9GV39_9PEZI|nr:cell cycle checkpoint protein RAD17 [Podospora aff. communis PSN243]